VAFVSSGERPSLISSSTLFGGGFSGAVRATELSVTVNMAASRILQTSISSQKNDKYINIYQEQQINNIIFSGSTGYKSRES